MVLTVTLKGGTPWGLRLQGGREFNEPIRIAKINPNSKAYNEGIQVGDYVESINGQKTKGLEHQDAQKLVKAATDQLILELHRVGSKPNGTMNGDIHHNHIDHELEMLNSGGLKRSKPMLFGVNAGYYDNKPGHVGTHPHQGCAAGNQPSEPSPDWLSSQGSGQSGRVAALSSIWSPKGDTTSKQYKPVSFNQKSSPSAVYASQTSPMTVTVNNRKARKSNTAPASPVLRYRQFNTAPTSPVMFQSTLKIPPLSPKATHRALVGRLQKGSVTSVSTDEPPKYWSSSPVSSCPSSPPMRPRLPKHFKPTPFLQQQLPPDLPKPTTHYTLPRRRTFRDFSPSSEDSGHVYTLPSRRQRASAAHKKSKGLELFRRQQQKLTEQGIPDTDDLDRRSRWQHTSARSPHGSGRSVSVDEGSGGWSLPIRVESNVRPVFGSPPLRSTSADAPRLHQYQPGNIVPPPRDFGTPRTEMPREIPIVYGGLNQGLKNLRQIPVEVEPSRSGPGSPRRQPGHVREVPVERSTPETTSQSPERPFGHQQRHIPIEIKQTSLGSPRTREKQPLHSKPETSLGSPRTREQQPFQSKPDHGYDRSEMEKKRADLERRRIDLERDIDNVIFEAIKQVPIYKQSKADTQLQAKPDSNLSRGESVDSDTIVPHFVESKRQQRVDEALQQNVDSNRMASMQREWEKENKTRQTECRDPATSAAYTPGSYATLPIKKSSSSLVQSPKPYDAEAGSYSTLPSFRHRNKESPKLPRSVSNDRDIDASFSDIEGGRGRAQPSWRPVASPKQSRNIWQPTNLNQSGNVWTPSSSPGMQRQQWGSTQSPPVTSSVPEGHVTMPVQDGGQQRSQYVPIQIQHEQTTRTVGENYEDEKDSSLSSFDTMDSSSEPKINGGHSVVKSSQKPGVWTPGMQQTSVPEPIERGDGDKKVSPTLKDVPQVWTPGGSSTWGPSKKGYRPIKPDFNKQPERKTPVFSADTAAGKPKDTFSWKPKPAESPAHDTHPAGAFTYQSAPSSHAPSRPDVTASTAPSKVPVQNGPSQNGPSHHVSTSLLHLKDEPSKLPPSQSPFITLLQKNRDDHVPGSSIEVLDGPCIEAPKRASPGVVNGDSPHEMAPVGSPGVREPGEGQENGYPKDVEFVGDPIMVTEEGKIPKGAIYLGKSESMEGDVKHTDSYYAVPTEEQTSSSTTVHSPKRYEDIGPLDTESGMPLAFRQNIDETKQHDWYKQMYKSLHKTKKKEGVLGITAMMDRMFEQAAANNYKPTYQFPEEDKSDTKSVDAMQQSPVEEPVHKTTETVVHASPARVDKSTVSPKPSSAICDFGIKSPKSPKMSLSMVSESLRKDAKYPCGKETKSADDTDVNPYRPSYELPRSVRGEIDAGYRSEPEYRSKLRSKSTSNVGKTSRALDLGSMPTDLEEFIRYLDEWAPPNARSNIEVYRNQPRSIVDYEPGFSSIAFRESKTQCSDRPKSYTGLSPGEREKLAKQRSHRFKVKAGTHNPPVDLPGQYSTYTEGRKRLTSEPSNSDSVNPEAAYRQIQHGGEIPYKGLQKPAPDKVTKKIRSQSASSSLQASTQPIKSFETHHQPIIKSHTNANHLQSQPIKSFHTADQTDSPETFYRTNGPILAGYVPNPPVRNPLRIKIPSSKRTRHRTSSQSAAEQLGVKSPPPIRTNGVEMEFNDSYAFRHPTTDEWRSKHIPSEKDRRRKEEEEAYRKRRLEQINNEERRKKLMQQQADIESRKHSDFLLPSQKSPIPMDRFEEPAGRYGVPEDRRRGFQIQGKARGVYNFTAQNQRELPFRKGDTLYLIRQVDSNWFEGERNGRVGIFPVNYVEVLTSIEEAQTAAMQSEGTARARYSFNSQTSVELPLRKGEMVTLLRRVDDNWFEGRAGNQQGIFPVSYVEVIREPSTPLVTPAPSVITTPMTGRGTPEMLSPMSFDGAPTPPPQPSPGAFHSSQTDNFSFQGNRYATSPRDQFSTRQDNRVTSPRSDHVSPQRFDRVQSQRQVDPSSSFSSTRHMNGGPGFSQPSSRHEELHGRRPSPQYIRKDNPPTLNITAKSMSTPNISVNAHDHNRNKVQQDEDLAITRYRAIYAYKPQNEDELELLEGDEVYVMEMCDDGWFVGTSGRTGMFGTFPGNYVTRTH